MKASTDLCSYERAGIALLLIIRRHPRPITTRAIAERLGASPSVTRRMLHKMSSSLPVYDDPPGVWRLSDESGDILCPVEAV